MQYILLFISTLPGFCFLRIVKHVISLEITESYTYSGQFSKITFLKDFMNTNTVLSSFLL